MTLDHPTLETDPELYRARLDKLREERIALEVRRDRVKRSIDAVKFGSVRENLEKKLAAIDKKLFRIRQLSDEVDVALKSKFGA